MFHNACEDLLYAVCNINDVEIKKTLLVNSQLYSRIRRHLVESEQKRYK